MPHHPVLGADRILISTKVTEATVKERLQPSFRILMPNRVTEGLPAADARTVLSLEFSTSLFDFGTTVMKGLGWNADPFWELLAIVGIETPLAPKRSSVAVEKQPHPPALMLIELGHKGFAAGGEVLLNHRSRSEKHRRVQDLQHSPRAVHEPPQAFLEQVVERISQVVADEPRFQQGLKVIFGGARLVMAAMENGVTLTPQRLRIHRH